MTNASSIRHLIFEFRHSFDICTSTFVIAVLMDLFSITCTTCKSRLKVREQAAIGQILACPKCGGMVMVKPPPNWSAGAAENAEQQTATEVIASVPQVNQTIHNSAFEALDDLLSDAPPKMRPPPTFATPAPPGPSPTSASPPSATPPSATPGGTPTPAKPRFVEGPRAISASGKVNVAPPFAEANRKTPTAPQPPAKDSAPLPPPPAEHEVGQPPHIAGGRARFWLLTAGSVLVGIVLAFVAVTAAIRFLRGPSASRALFSGTPAGPAQTPTVERPAPESTARPPEVTPAEPPAESPNPAAATPAVPAPAPPESSPPAALPPAADPLGIVTTPPPAADARPPSTDSLAKFDRLIGGNNEDPLAKSAAAAPPADAPPPMADDAVPTRPVAPRPPPREIDVAKRLADPLPGIETTGTPLADFLQVISDLSTIPITVEPEGFPFVNVTAASSVVVSASNTTVGGALTAALKPLKLQAIESDGQLIVRAEEPAQPATLNFPVKDLAADEESIAALDEMLKALVEPASWGDAPEQGTMAVDAAKGTIAIRNSRAVHAQLLLLCEKLRTARGLKPLSRIDPAQFKLDTRAARALARLETPISLNYSQPTRLTVVLDRLGELGGVRILVDWQGVAAAGWNPAGEATLVISQQPLSAALDAFLAPLDLTWRVIDGQTLQVVTPARLNERTEIELYKVAELIASDPTGEALLAKIRAALGDAAFRAAGGNGEIRFDEAGKCLIAALPQPKQRELEVLLAQWRSELKSK